MPTKAQQYKPHGIRKPSEAMRGNSAARGYDHKWRESRLNFLRAYPLCCGCDPTEERKEETIEDMQRRSADHNLTHAHGCDGIATQVDHKIPAGKRDQLFYDITNYRGRSASCHSWKTRRFDMPR